MFFNVILKSDISFQLFNLNKKHFIDLHSLTKHCNDLPNIRPQVTNSNIF
jgi:hypothetical protein